MPIDTILVAARNADNQTRLLDAVTDIAVATGASVVLAKAYEQSEYKKRVEELEFESQPSTDDVAQRSQTVREIGATLQESVVEYEVRGVVGEEGTAFVDLAEAVDSDILYIQGKGRSPTGKALFGSTVQTILLNAPCPVTYVRS